MVFEQCPRFLHDVVRVGALGRLGREHGRTFQVRRVQADLHRAVPLGIVDETDAVFATAR